MKIVHRCANQCVDTVRESMRNKEIINTEANILWYTVDSIQCI